MKNLLALFFLLAAAGIVSAQPQQIQYTSTTPSGTCSQNGIRLLTPTGVLYTCQNGTWAIATGGGGGGSPNCIIAFTAQTSVTVTAGSSCNGTSTHGFATTGLIVAAYDNSVPAALLSSTVTVSSAFTVVVGFQQTETGYLVINGSGGSGGGSFTALTGDASSTSTGGATTVLKVNGGAVPTTATVVGTNGSQQLIAASVQGNGTKVQLSTGTTTTNDCVKFDVNGNTVDAGAACGAGSPAFSTITSGTNTAMAALVGSGASLGPTGSGTVSANQVNGAVAPASATAVATNSSRQLVAATVQGNGTKVQLSTGTTTSGDCVQYDANGNATDAGAPCGGGSGTFNALTGDATSTPTGGATSVVKVNGGSVPASAALVATNGSSQFTPVTTIPTSTVPAFTGDMTNSAGSLATTVVQVNGAAIPASKAFLGSNSSNQLVQTTLHHPIGLGWGIKGGSTLTTSSVGYYTVPFACTITRWDATVDTGTITFDVWKIATGTAIPTVTNTIVASAAPAIASNTAAHSSTLTGWTTSVAQYDIFGFNISALTGSPTTASLILTCDQ